MKKICFVVTVSVTIKSFLADFADYLVKNSDYDVTLICNEDKMLFSYCGERIHYFPVKMKRGIGVDGLKVINQLTHIFKQEHFDIIQYSTPNASFYASIAAKKANCKHRLYCQWGVRYMGFETGITRWLFKRIEKVTCNNSSVIECESFSLYEFGLKQKLYSATKASVIWNGSACGVDLSRFDFSQRLVWRNKIRKDLNIGEEAIIFGYMGRITKDKGVNELFAAFQHFQNKKDIYLLMIGTFDKENTIEPKYREWAKNNSQVIFVDWTDRVEQYYSAMDVFISLSYREGFGLVVIEAAAMGTPAIVTDVPGQIDTIVPGIEGIVVPVKNISMVIDAINFCISNRDIITKMGQNARERCNTMFEQKELFRRLAQHRDEIIAQKV